MLLLSSISIHRYILPRLTDPNVNKAGKYLAVIWRFRVAWHDVW